MDHKTALLGALIAEASDRRDALKVETDLRADRVEWGQSVSRRLIEAFGDGDVALGFNGRDCTGSLSEYEDASDALVAAKGMYEADIRYFREVREGLQRS